MLRGLTTKKYSFSKLASVLKDANLLGFKYDPILRFCKALDEVLDLESTTRLTQLSGDREYNVQYS